MDNAKFYIFHTEVFVTGEPMQCVYLLRESCHAQPFISTQDDYYKPTEDEKKDICQDGNRFRACPRLIQYQDYLARTVKK